MFDVKHLQTLVALEHHGSLSAAAQSLFVTPTALSHQIRQLEERLSTRIFVRKSSPLQFTAAGLRLIELAHQVLPAIESTLTDLQRIADAGHHARLKIAVACHCCFEWLIPLLNRYRQSWPEVNVDLAPDMRFDAIAQLANGGLDMVITSDIEIRGDIHYARLFDYQLVVVSGLEHPLSQQNQVAVEDLLKWPLLVYPVERKRLDVIRLLLEPAGLQHPQLISCDTTMLILQKAAAGMGVALLPDWAVQAFAKRSLVHSLALAQPVGRTLYAATRADERNSAHLRGFIEILAGK